MSTAVRSRPNPTAKFTVLEGPMKGAIRLSRGREIVLGRSPECDFVIVNDPRVSRRHAQIVLTTAGYEVQSLNERNPVGINGRPAPRGLLNDGDVLTVGGTEMRFNIVYGRDDQHLALVNPAGAAAPVGSSGYTQSSRPRTSSRAAPAGGSKVPTRYIVYGVIALLVGWVVFSDSSVKKKKETTIRNDQQIEADIKAANQLREASEASDFRKTEMNLALRQAQENYVRGFRDFRKGQFERALTSFQACLALNPEHALCNRYLRLTQRKFDELVQYEVVLGRKYREQNLYQACRSSFRNVMVMVKDPQSKIFKEAKANYDACDSLVEGRY